MRNKLLSIIMSVVLLFGSFGMAFGLDSVTSPAAGNFSDMPDNWSTAALNKAVDNGLLSGYVENGKKLIKAGNSLTRAEMAAVVNRAFASEKTADISKVSDVPASAWYAKDMAKAVKMGTFAYSTKMRPGDKISRQEAFTVLARAFKLVGTDSSHKALGAFSDKGDIAAWALDSLDGMAAAGYIQGSGGKLNPTANITRAEFAVVMDNLVKDYIDVKGDVTETVAKGNVVVRTPGTVLKNLTIKGDLIIADGVGEGEVTLDNVKVEGRTVVRGGGQNSIIIKGGSELGKVIVAKVDGVVRIFAEDGAEIEVIYVDDGSDDVIVEGTFGALEVAGDGVDVYAKKANINNATVSGDNSKIIVGDGSKVKNGSITGDSSAIIVDEGGTVDKITVSGPDATVGGDGKVGEVEVGKGVEGTEVGGKPVEGGQTVDGSGAPAVPPSSGGGGGGSAPPFVPDLKFDSSTNLIWGQQNPTITLSLTNDTFTEDANKLESWIIQAFDDKSGPPDHISTVGLTVSEISKDSETSITIIFTGTIKEIAQINIVPQFGFKVFTKGTECEVVHVNINAPTTGPTVTGTLSNTMPEGVIENDNVNYAIVYTLGETYIDGAVVFILPTTCAAIAGGTPAGDQYSIGSNNKVHLDANQMSNDGTIITIGGIHASRGTEIILYMNKEHLPAGTYEISAQGDADGDGDARTLSEISTTTFTVLGTDTVATIGAKQYGNLVDAISDAHEGQTIKLFSDIITTAGTCYHFNKNITIDLNGHEISGPANGSCSVEGTATHFFRVVNGTLTIDDTSSTKNGSISCSYAANSQAFAIEILTGAKVVLNEGMLTNNGMLNFGGSIIYLRGTAEFIMNGGIVQSSKYSSTKSIYPIFMKDSVCTFIMNGGTITSDSNPITYNGTISISSGELRGKAGVKGLKPSYIADQSYCIFDGEKNMVSATLPTSYSAHINEKVYYNIENAGNLAISDASSGDIVTLYETASENKVLSPNSTLTIIIEKGGSYTGAISSSHAGYGIVQRKSGNTTTYSAEVTESSAIAKWENTFYATATEALIAAYNENSNSPVILLKDSSFVISGIKGGKLDLNGKKIEASGSTSVLSLNNSSSDYSLTIIDTVGGGQIINTYKSKPVVNAYFGTINIQAGIYTGNEATNVLVASAASGDKTAGNFVVTGGTFSSDPTPYVDLAQFVIDADTSPGRWTVTACPSD